MSVSSGDYTQINICKWLHPEIRRVTDVHINLSYEVKCPGRTDTGVKVIRLAPGRRESRIYLKATSDMQRYFLDVGSGESFQAVLSPLLYQVIEGLLSSVLHGQTL